MGLRGFIALVAAVSVLSACSGGGGGGGSQPPSNPRLMLSGTVAGNVPLAGYIVDILAPLGPNSAVTAQTMAGSDGRYSGENPLASGPIPIVAWKSALDDQAHYPRVWSIAHRSGTANVTPLTSLVVAKLLNRRPGKFDNRGVSELQAKTEADVSTAQQQVVNYLLGRTNPVNVGSVGNFVSTPLTIAPGDVYFDAIVQLHNSLMDSETIAGVEEHMLFGSDGPANLLAMLSLDFMANCTPSTNSAMVPSGSTRIIVDRRAIAFGALDVPFQSNDQLTINAGPERAPWIFIFASGHAVNLNVLEGRLESIAVSTPAGGSECVPQSEVLVTGKHPSLIALIKLLAQSVGNPASFQCATSGDFLTNGTHMLSFDTQGAARINAPGGHALHLASLNITVGATLTVVGAQVQPILPTSFSAAREFGDGVDSFDVRHSSGQITGLRLARQNLQDNRAQTCGTI